MSTGPLLVTSPQPREGPFLPKAAVGNLPGDKAAARQGTSEGLAPPPWHKLGGLKWGRGGQGGCSWCLEEGAHRRPPNPRHTPVHELPPSEAHSFISTPSFIPHMATGHWPWGRRRASGGGRSEWTGDGWGSQSGGGIGTASHCGPQAPGLSRELVHPSRCSGHPQLPVCPCGETKAQQVAGPEVTEQPLSLASSPGEVRKTSGFQ